jgi:hypothetical protein
VEGDGGRYGGDNEDPNKWFKRIIGGLWMVGFLLLTIYVIYLLAVSDVALWVKIVVGWIAVSVGFMFGSVGLMIAVYKEIDTSKKIENVDANSQN